MNKVYTNMCMLYDDHDQILVMNRTKNDWPGLTFPGGHVEDGEDFISSVIREFKEETGLTIKNPEYVGQISWPDPKKGIDEIALLYRTNQYEGAIKQCDEGEVFFIKKCEVGNYPPSHDFDRVLKILLNFSKQ